MIYPSQFILLIYNFCFNNTVRKIVRFHIIWNTSYKVINTISTPNIRNIFVHHHVHHPLIRKQNMLTYQCVNTTTGSEMVRSEGLEPPTFWFEVKYSIQLTPLNPYFLTDLLLNKYIFYYLTVSNLWQYLMVFNCYFFLDTIVVYILGFSCQFCGVDYFFLLFQVPPYW